MYDASHHTQMKHFDCTLGWYKSTYFRISITKRYWVMYVDILLQVSILKWVILVAPMGYVSQYTSLDLKFGWCRSSYSNEAFYLHPWFVSVGLPSTPSKDTTLAFVSSFYQRSLFGFPLIKIQCLAKATRGCLLSFSSNVKRRTHNGLGLMSATRG